MYISKALPLLLEAASLPLRRAILVSHAAGDLGVSKEASSASGRLRSPFVLTTAMRAAERSLF